MRRLAFLTAASLAFIAIPEPISANDRDYQECIDKCSGPMRIRITCEKKCKNILPNGKNGGKHRKTNMYPIRDR